MYRIQPFQPGKQGYRAIAALLRAVRQAKARQATDQPGLRDGETESAEELEREDAEWPPASLLKRFVAFPLEGDAAGGAAASPDARPVGAVVCYEAYWQHRPGTVHLHFDLDPDHAGVELLADLFGTAYGFARGRDGGTDCLACRVREDDVTQMSFLEGEGFVEAMRYPSAALRAADFDAARFGALLQRVARSGIRILDLAELRGREPDWKRKLRDLRWTLLQDVRSPEPPTRPTVEEFEEMVLRDPALEEGAFRVAVDGDGWFAGMSNLWRNDPAGGRWDCGLTGVIQRWRRRGLATALKVETVRFAQSEGAEWIVTSNEEGSPMLGLNRRLGFRSGPAWISLRKPVPPR